MEWSLRHMRANSVVGMWHDVQMPAGPSARWRLWAGASSTRASWHGRQAPFGSSFHLYRPLEVWQWTQSIRPDRTHGLMSQEVRV
jgi:hypothetical protein